MVNENSKRHYPSDLTDEEWRIVEPLIPVKTGTGAGPGKPRTLSMRQVINALLYLDRTGCQWRYLPKDFPNYNSVRYYFDTWRKDGTWQRITLALRQYARQQERDVNNARSAVVGERLSDCKEDIRQI